MLTIFYNHILEAMKQENLSLKEIAKIANKCGIYGLELDYRDLNPTGKKFNKELADELKEAGLPVYGVYVNYDWARHPFDGSFKKIYKELQSIGVKYSLAIPGMVPDGMKKEKAMKRMAKRLAKVVSYAKECGICVLMEDFDYVKSPISTAEGMKYFFDRIPELKCAFDTGNFYYSDENVLDVLPMFIDKVEYVHCKDRALLKKDGETPTINVSGVELYSSAVGEGIIPIKEVITKLLENGYKGDFAIEHFGSQTQLRDMKASAEYLNSIL